MLGSESFYNTVSYDTTAHSAIVRTQIKLWSFEFTKDTYLTAMSISIYWSPCYNGTVLYTNMVERFAPESSGTLDSAPDDMRQSLYLPFGLLPLMSAYQYSNGRRGKGHSTILVAITGTVIPMSYF